MAFAPSGSLARRRQARALEATIQAQKACAHAQPARGRGGPATALYDYVCPDCHAVLRTYERRGRHWVCVYRAEDATHA